MKRYRKSMKSGIIILLLICVCCNIHILYQFGPQIQYEGDRWTWLPNGTSCFLYECKFLEKLFIPLFAAEQISPEDHPAFQGDSTPQPAAIYRIRGRSSPADLIARTEDEWWIIRPSRFTNYCWTSAVSHQQIFSTIMEQFYSCSSFADIRSIRVSPESSSASLFSSQKLNTRDGIFTFWTLLMQGDYDCGSESCNDGALARDVGDLSKSKLVYKNSYRITIKFRDGAKLRLTYSPDVRAMWIPWLPLSQSGDEALYFTETENQMLMELFSLK